MTDFYTLAVQLAEGMFIAFCFGAIVGYIAHRITEHRDKKAPPI